MSYELKVVDGEAFVMVPVGDYADMIEDVEFLECLKSAGVDNWGGYDYAVELSNQGEDDE